MANGSDRKKQIMEVTEDMICEQGYDKTTVEAIITEIGIAKGTFYHHFRSKEEALDAIVDDILDDMRTNVESIVADGDADAVLKLDRIFQFFWEATFSRQKLWDCILEEQNAYFHTKFDNKLARLLVPNFMKVIEQGAGEGTFDVPDTFVCANAVLGATFFTPREKLDQYEYDPGPNYTENNCHILERILGAEKGALRNCLTRGVVLEGEEA